MNIGDLICIVNCTDVVLATSSYSSSLPACKTTCFAHLRTASIPNSTRWYGWDLSHWQRIVRVVTLLDRWPRKTIWRSIYSVPHMKQTLLLPFCSIHSFPSLNTNGCYTPFIIQFCDASHSYVIVPFCDMPHYRDCSYCSGRRIRDATVVFDSQIPCARLSSKVRSFMSPSKLSLVCLEAI